MIDQKGFGHPPLGAAQDLTERIKAVDLAPDDYYDLVFVVVPGGPAAGCASCAQGQQEPVFCVCGQQPAGKAGAGIMQRPADKIAFGFQGTAGRREHDHVVSVYASAGICGGRCHNSAFWHPSEPGSRPPLTVQKYKLTFYGDMDEWLGATLHSFCRRARCAMPATAICTGPPAAARRHSGCRL